VITVNDIIRSLPRGHGEELQAPSYTPAGFGPEIGLCVPSMMCHTSDEGWQIFKALESAGYHLVGRGLPLCGYETDVGGLVYRTSPSVVVLQDKREWEGKTAGSGFDMRERFTNVTVLKDRHDIFKATILKDAHQQPLYHRQSADEIGCHAWIV